MKNTKASIEWYQEKCGFSLRWHHEEGDYAAMDIGDGETAFTLMPYDQMGGQYPENHEWFNLYTSDATAAHEQLSSSGVEVTDVMKDGTVEFFSFKDPDGNVIGICSFKE